MTKPKSFVLILLAISTALPILSTIKPTIRSSYLCDEILRTAYRYTCDYAGARDSADCYYKSKRGIFDQDEYHIYWQAVCRRNSERDNICSFTDLPRNACERADCEGMKPEWTFTIGDRDGDPCP